ncbi:hypothetical protein RO3G_06014 [Lichtheimia corymbifera JMRC:FSU:9682]|uniref:FAR1 domain-containing protein n=1 Tax=Lichtheimia corymbifera JMRC:FSU:9682 TaxID=1263082 RepID=A0A068RZ29_9FUNG|nr:hypothetical protein RO3G_06014 [Lichtheimia corymbifera JMRC:FSU:9682]
MASPIEASSSSQQLDPFYIELLEQTFTTSKAAIDFCRNLCAQFGFTVKQESSTHRNIYVYCSREGLADSVRNPKSNPKRKRPSKRCDCKWRVVLNESKDTHLWRFRKSNNPEALQHNHPLMRPEEVERGWPKQVHELIRELARQHLSTQEIRQQVQNRFPDITWNERRFYNRLSEERQKIRQQDTTGRAHQLTATWTKVCMAAAGCEELTDYAQTQLMQMLDTICNMAQIPVDSLGNPPALSSEEEEEEEDSQNNHDTATTTPPKGFTVVVIPEHTYLVKVYNQRTIQRKRQLAQPAPPQTTTTTQQPPQATTTSMQPPAPPPQQQQFPSTTPFSNTNSRHRTPMDASSYMMYPPNMPMHYYPSLPEEDNMAFPPLDTSSVASSSSPSPVSVATPPPAATVMMNAPPTAADRLMPPPLKRRRSSHHMSSSSYSMATAATQHHPLAQQRSPSSPIHPNNANNNPLTVCIPGTPMPTSSPQQQPPPPNHHHHHIRSQHPPPVLVTSESHRHHDQPQMPFYQNYW